MNSVLENVTFMNYIDISYLFYIEITWDYPITYKAICKVQKSIQPILALIDLIE